MKLNREAMRSYLDVKMTSKASDAAQAEWEVLGDDITDMSVELNSEVEQTKNILGQTKTTDNGYTPSMDADPFYADPEKKIYPVMRDIALERKTGDECKTLMLEVIVEDTSAANHLAFVREVLVKPTSYGGDATYVNIPFNVSEDGAFVKGYVSKTSLESGTPTFTSGNIPA